MKLFWSQRYHKLEILIFSLIIVLCIGLCVFINEFGIVMPLLALGISGLIGVELYFIKRNSGIIWFLLVFIFMFMLLTREIGGIPYGTLQEGIMFLGCLALIFSPEEKDWKILGNDLCKIVFIWFVISILEIANPAGASIQGWLQEIRAAALYPCVVVAIGFLVLKHNSDLNTFLFLILTFSLLATLNGIKQMYIGLSPGEQRFIDEGGYITHVLFGRLRVFSFYSDAGQFGASQAHIGLIALILALGPFKLWKRVILLIAAGLLFYGMLISGTRGAIFALIVGVCVALVLSKKFKVMLLGGLVALAVLFVLKYTYIGNGNYEIYRLRTAFDSKDASLNTRLTNQLLLRDYLSSRPLGGGLGVIGVWGTEYNKDKYLSTIAPDSYWVKVWAMYGIVGFTIWFSMMMYILGKCCGIVWGTKNEGLKIKLIALTSGYAGILICSYGNEVINTAPSSYIIYLSWVLVFLGPKFDYELENKALRPLN